MRKLAIKRLTASDLTFFEYHYHNHPAGFQKAINLNANVFINILYPALQEATRDTGGRVPLDLSLYGPGEAGLHNLQRKIIKGSSYKNWRLNGELIYDPVDEPGRYNVLHPDDLAVMEFYGNVVPGSAAVILVASGDTADQPLHAALSALMPAGRRSMIAVSQADLEAAVSSVAVSDQHPVRQLLVDALLENVAMGGSGDAEPATALPRLPVISLERLQRARRMAQEIGRRGEEYINAHLYQQRSADEIHDYEWVSDSNAVSPFDFRLSPDVDSVRLIDVKATSGPYNRQIHISLNELRQMAYGDEDYDLYRLYEMSDESAKLRRGFNLRSFATSVLAVLYDLPPGVRIDGISVFPDTVVFEPEEIILATPFIDD